jgi:hypothetical protein
MKNPQKMLVSGIRRAVIAALSASILTGVEASEVDFSCMSFSVRGKTPLTSQFKEYDVILTNRCPGSVYWTMCIERLDPLSHDNIEIHNPSGMIEEEQKVRVNLQMKRGADSMGSQKRYQEFYLGIGYAVKPPAQAPCVATRCEAENRPLRQELDTNLAAWQRAQADLSKRIAAECPESGWGRTDETEACEAALRQAEQANLEAFLRKDSQLRERLHSVHGAGCQVHGGDLVDPR